jgi:hypothetical protein
MFDETLASRVARLQEAALVANEAAKQAAAGHSLTTPARNEEAKRLQEALDAVAYDLNQVGF